MNDDRRLYARLCAGDLRRWRDLKRDDIHNAGQNELLNWVCLSGASEARRPEVLAYSGTYPFNPDNAAGLSHDR